MKNFDELEWEAKETFLHEMICTQKYSDILNLLSNSDSVTKCDIIEILGNFSDISGVASIISKYLTDNDFVVRCQAVEALSYSKNEDIFQTILENLYKEKNSIVRGYYASAIIDMCREKPVFKTLIDENSIKELYKTENSTRGKIACNSLLYCLNGDISHTKGILKFLDHPDYRIRCTAINSLCDIMDKKNYSLIHNALKEQLKKEKAKSVLSSINRALGNNV